MGIFRDLGIGLDILAIPTKFSPASYNPTSVTYVGKALPVK